MKRFSCRNVAGLHQRKLKRGLPKRSASSSPQISSHLAHLPRPSDTSISLTRSPELPLSTCSTKTKTMSTQAGLAQQRVSLSGTRHRHLKSVYRSSDP